MDVTTVLRVAFSLAVVMGLLWLSYRVADRSRRSASTGRDAQLVVVARQGLSPKSSAVLLEAGGTRYLLGVTESSVTVIDHGPAPAVSAVPASARPKHAVRGGAVPRLGPFNVVKSTTAARTAAAGEAATSGRGEQVDLPVPSDARAGDGRAAGEVPELPEVPEAPVDAPSFDEAVLAAQVWLGEPSGLTPGDPADARPASGPVQPGSTTALARPGVSSRGGTRSLLAPDTWREAARAVWGPRR